MKVLIGILIIMFLSACGDSFSNESKYDVKKITVSKETGGGSGGLGGHAGDPPGGGN